MTNIIKRKVTFFLHFSCHVTFIFYFNFVAGVYDFMIVKHLKHKPSQSDIILINYFLGKLGHRFLLFYIFPKNSLILWRLFEKCTKYKEMLLSRAFKCHFALILSTTCFVDAAWSTENETL